MKSRKIMIMNIASTLLIIAFSLLIVLVKTADVAAIGPEGTTIGLSALNGAVHNAIGYNAIWYKISEIAGALAFPVIAVFAFYGLYQLIKGKGFKAVDKDLYLLAILYISVIAIYIFFELVVINYRPVLEDGNLAASFPSSHTLLAITVYGSAIIVIKDIVMKREIKAAVIAVLSILMVLTVCARMLSGVHWATDIIGSILLSASLLLLFKSIREQIR